MKHSKTYTDVKNIPNVFEKINKMDNLGIINAKSDSRRNRKKY